MLNEYDLQFAIVEFEITSKHSNQFNLSRQKFCRRNTIQRRFNSLTIPTSSKDPRSLISYQAVLSNGLGIDSLSLIKDLRSNQSRVRVGVGLDVALPPRWHCYSSYRRFDATLNNDASFVLSRHHEEVEKRGRQRNPLVAFAMIGPKVYVSMVLKSCQSKIDHDDYRVKNSEQKGKIRSCAMIQV
jgi:hypothetical protein